MSSRLSAALLAAAALAGACSDDNLPVGTGNLTDYSLVADIAPDENTKLDLLFVIDDSASMAEEQASLVAWAQASLFDTLELDMDTVPDLHIGIVSTNMGTGGFAISSCDGAGDDGNLLDAPRAEGCTPPSDPYIIDAPDGSGGRVKNYTDTIAEAFSCIALLGVGGCGFEQPLASMRRALDGTIPGNEGFLRDDAILAVVIVSDEDDCSAADPTIFDPGADESLLGPLSSFRCFEWGVQCAEPDPRAPGARTDCRVRDDSPYIAQVSDYVDFLRALKADPSMVVVAGIFGDPGSVTVGTGVPSGAPELLPSCESASGTAAPAIRLQALLDSFPGRSWYSSICHETMEMPLMGAGHVIGGAASGSPCLLGTIEDQDAAAAGLQADCRVFAVASAGTLEDARAEIPACGGGGGTCFTLVDDAPQCAHTDSHLAVSLTGDVGADDHLLVACRQP